MRRRRWTSSRALKWWRRILRNDLLLLALLAIVVGGVVGGAVILFREGIAALQALGYGSRSEFLAEQARLLPDWRVVAVPTAGGLLVGLILRFVMPRRRAEGVADVIEACATRGSRMSLRSGLGAALASVTALGSGASVGREGPAVHLGATLGAWIAERLRLTRSLSRTLLGCGVAAAVAGSFNAPIAGALFANEVVVGHYGLTAFAPIVVASLTGTILSRAYYGDYPAFSVAESPINSLVEFPAFAGLGLACGLLAVLFIELTRAVEETVGRTPLPPWLRPAIGGFLVGILALWVPEVLGVGYGTTHAALQERFGLGLLVGLMAAKLLATSVCLGCGMAGGVFSPSLVIGALAGGAYGIAMVGMLGDLSSGGGAYVLTGMGAMAAAVLGAPISTTLIIFEMTGDYTLTMAVMLASVTSSVVVRQWHHASFFHAQLARRGLDLRGGFAAALLRDETVARVMKAEAEVVTEDMSLRDLRVSLQLSKVGELFVVDGDGRLIGTITLSDLDEAAFDPGLDPLIVAGDVARRDPPVLFPDDDLGRALEVMRTRGEETVAVIRRDGREFVGLARACDVMEAYNRRLIEARAEERGERRF